jgi:hypothetical protein
MEERMATLSSKASDTILSPYRVRLPFGPAAGKGARLEWQGQGIGQLEMDVPALRKGRVSGRDVHRKDASVREAAPQLKPDAAGAATDIQARSVDRKVGQVDQDLRESASPAPEEALVGGPLSAQ